MARSHLTAPKTTFPAAGLWACGRRSRFTHTAKCHLPYIGCFDTSTDRDSCVSLCLSSLIGVVSSWNCLKLRTWRQDPKWILLTHSHEELRTVQKTSCCGPGDGQEGGGGECLYKELWRREEEEEGGRAEGWRAKERERGRGRVWTYVRYNCESTPPLPWKLTSVMLFLKQVLIIVEGLRSCFRKRDINDKSSCNRKRRSSHAREEEKVTVVRKSPARPAWPRPCLPNDTRIYMRQQQASHFLRTLYIYPTSVLHVANFHNLHFSKLPVFIHMNNLHSLCRRSIQPLPCLPTSSRQSPWTRI